jgi:predicted nuclease of predicted toxin-antitoxin system
MIFLADENIDFPIIQFLRVNECDIKSILEEYPSVDDDFVLNLANEQNRILITSDKDFGELVFRLNKVHHGIILLRLEELSSKEKAKIILQVIQDRKQELINSFTVISEKFVRIRK